MRLLCLWRTSRATFATAARIAQSKFEYVRTFEQDDKVGGLIYSVAGSGRIRIIFWHLLYCLILNFVVAKPEKL